MPLNFHIKKGAPDVLLTEISVNYMGEIELTKNDQKMATLNGTFFRV